MAYISTKTTVQLGATEDRVPRLVEVDIAELEPEVGPLITLLNKVKGRSEAVDGQKPEWFEHERLSKWASAAAAVGASASSTTVTVDDGTKFLVGDLFFAVPAISSSDKPELIRVQSKSGNVLTVTRNIGSAGLNAITSADSLYIVADAQEEYSAIPSARTNAPTNRYTYLQIFRTAIDFSNSAIAIKVYGAQGGERKREHRDQMIEHKRKLNDALYWGIASYSATAGENSKALRTTAGIRNVITTNVTDGGGTLTVKKLWDFARSAFRYGTASDRAFVVAPMISQAVNSWALNHVMVTPSEKKFGISIQSIETPHGVWRMIRDRQLEDGVSGKNGFSGLGFSLDFDQITYCYLKGNGLNRDTHVEMDVVQGGADGKKDQIITEAGFKIKLEKLAGMLYNVSDYMA
jgi:hypothetical protein